MDTSSSTSWIVESGQEDRHRPLLEDLVMAWARDRTTGEPRYIGELKAHQTGAACNCECYSCGLPLQAVNAGNPNYKRRPSFRHPAGAAKDECLILSARVAALEMLQREGNLRLPVRRIEGAVQGLSGQYHNAWAVAPAETVRVARFEFRDKTAAVITLDDGRIFRLVLEGSIAAQQHDFGATSLIPTIVMAIDDPALAGMPPDELRKRITIISEHALWCSHWNDKALAKEAEDKAVDEARQALDWGAADRETLLHLIAKQILEEEKRIRLPDLTSMARTTLQDGESLTASKSYLGAMVQLDDVVLEKGIGRTRPDVIAQMRESFPWEAGPILIEVTVTNAITEERMQRIRQNNLPTLEIDIRQLGGKVSRGEYARLVVDEVAGKRWLYHPAEVLLRQRATVTLTQLASERNREIEQRREQEAEQAKFRKIPESLQRIIPPPSERTAAGSYPRKPNTHDWKHGPVSTANNAQWRSCGCTQWEDVLHYGENGRAERQPVAIALRMCSERYSYSVGLLRGIWLSAGLIQ
ncbi:hypothetical protein [Dechloromonas denitrificans]|uniref:hypothetical protein n=1 Tax=Dechloromonas denitrificans TaxID=281362 RepID=UPI001CF828CB|nr:hypothetical protein [Dechloromonas denitrificans]UCV02960.1 hypothetical protein KI611_18065 [Dechloromonas denitrificans]